jgi:hypothetical protein
VTIVSQSKFKMGLQTTHINDQIDAVILGDGWELPTVAVSKVVEAGNGRVQLDVAGFEVDSVLFNSVTNTWDIECRFAEGVANTLTSPYISRVGTTSPYSETVLNSYEISKFPCQNENPSVCCLLNYRDKYTVGSFATIVTEKVGDCNATVMATNTKSLFDSVSSGSLVVGLLDDYPLSSVLSRQGGGFLLSISQGDLLNHFSRRKDGVNGAYELVFFVGMSYFTLFQGPVVATAASQVQITISISPSLTFAYTSQQEHNVAEYLTATIFENKWMDNFATVHHMQFVGVSVLLPQGYIQNPHTGLVPLHSIRFAVGEQMPDKIDGMWFNACYSDGNSGLFDEDSSLKGGSDPSYESMYKDSAAQQCAYRKQMCTNPSTDANMRLGTFNIPIGDGTVTSIMQTAEDSKIYVTFQLSVYDENGASVYSDVFLELPIKKLSLSKACQQIDESMSLGSMSEVDLIVGLAGTNEEWDTSVSVQGDAMRNVDYNSFINTGVQHSSLASSLVTLVVKASPIIRTTSDPNELTFSLDYFTSMHFLDAAKFTSVQALMGTDDAYKIDLRNNFLEVMWTNEASESCSTLTNNLYSCAIRRSVIAGVSTPCSMIGGVSTCTGVQDFALSDHQNDDAGCASFITSNLLGDNGFARELATNMTKLVRDKYQVDNYLTRAWYINPGYQWPVPQGVAAQSQLALTDKMIAVAVISLRDATTGVIRARR